MGAVSLYLVNFVRDTYLSNLEERLEQEAGLVGETTARYFRGPLDCTLSDPLRQVGGFRNEQLGTVSAAGGPQVCYPS